jgi:hypothetical protein
MEESVFSDPRHELSTDNEPYWLQIGFTTSRPPLAETLPGGFEYRLSVEFQGAFQSCRGRLGVLEKCRDKTTGFSLIQIHRVVPLQHLRRRLANPGNDETGHGGSFHSRRALRQGLILQGDAGDETARTRALVIDGHGEMYAKA